MKTVLFFVLCFGASVLGAREAHSATKSMKAYDENKKGIESAIAGKTDDSKKRFSDALTADPDSAEIVHNQGVLQLQDQKLKEAIQLFESSSKQAEQTEQYDVQARSLYDLGIAKSAEKDIPGAADAYIRSLESLRKSPDQKLEAMVRHNLELLFKKQSGNGGGKDDKNKDDKNKDDQKKDQDDQNKKGGESGDSNDPKNDKNKDEKDGDQDKKKQQSQAPKAGKQRDFRSLKLSKEDAERVLQGLAQAEEKLQDRMKRQKGRPQGLEKDW